MLQSHKYFMESISVNLHRAVHIYYEVKWFYLRYKRILQRLGVNLEKLCDFEIAKVIWCAYNPNYKIETGTQKSNTHGSNQQAWVSLKLLVFEYGECNNETAEN